MSEEKNKDKKKKNPLSAIWEPMNKTSGCCGSGETCCAPKKEADKETKNKS